MGEGLRGRGRGWILGLVGLTLACEASNSTGVVVPGTGSTSSSSSLSTVEIPMPIQNFQVGSSALKLLGLPVAVGPDSSQLLLDTGSAGLRIFAEAAPGVTRLGIPSRAEFGDGTVYEGELALATVLIGPVTTETPIVIQVVDQVGCIPTAPNCPGRDGPGTFIRAGFEGILGISLGARTSSLDLYSPLTRLPGNFDSGYIIETGGYAAILGRFTLGLTSENQRGFRQGGLAQIGAGSPVPLQFPDGTPAWDDAAIQSFYTVTPAGSAPLSPEVAARTLFDTGSSDIILELFQQIPSTQVLASGGRFRTRFPSLFDLEFQVGFPMTPSFDRVFLDPLSEDPLQILGMPFFFRYDTSFDIERGRIGFRAR